MSTKSVDELPRVLPAQEGTLIGLVEKEPTDTEFAAYYLHGQRSIALGHYEEETFTPEFVFETQSRILSASVYELNSIDATTELSDIGKSLIQAWYLGEQTTLTHKQAHVYALREKADMSRSHTAAVLHLSPNTVDNHLRRAREKVTAAEHLVQLSQASPDELSSDPVDILPESATGTDSTPEFIPTS